MHVLSDERINKMEKWLLTVDSITMVTVSLSKNDDPFTRHDKKSYDVVKYMNGEVKWNLTSVTKLSEKLHLIDSLINKWGLTFKYIDGWQNNIYHWKGDSVSIDIEINLYNENLLKINKNPKWINFDKSNIEEIIDNYFIEYAKNSNNALVKRNLNLEYLLK